MINISNNLNLYIYSIIYYASYGNVLVRSIVHLIYIIRDGQIIGPIWFQSDPIDKLSFLDNAPSLLGRKVQ